jgi:hypothetical protein
MALCVALTSDGTLHPTGQPVSECAGYVMVSSSEYGVYQALQDAFGVPTPEQASGWFVGAWGAVVVMFILSRWVGSVVSMFNK